jgi:ATP-dependent DNA helicase RecQ
VVRVTRAIEGLARDRLGFTQLRPGQLSAVEALAGDRDVLAVLPTGGGKSAIYELAGLLREGPTIVVSPLIALQDDQLAHLRASGLSAIVLNSQQSASAHAIALLASCDSGTFVFLSPEQLAIPAARETLTRARPGLFAVDEAHLISQWGQDFRPDYMMLGAQSEAVGARVRLALTATAAPPVRTEITRRLGLRNPEVVIGDFDRAASLRAVPRGRSRGERTMGRGLSAALRRRSRHCAVRRARLPRALRSGRSRPWPPAVGLASMRPRSAVLVIFPA